MKRITSIISIIIFAGILSGCSTGPDGSEESARAHFQNEFNKFIAGKKSEVTTINVFMAPISYDIRSVVADDPDSLATDRPRELPDDWRTWPAYRFNVAIEWKSESGTASEKVTTFTLTWNPGEAKWYIKQRF